MLKLSKIFSSIIELFRNSKRSIYYSFRHMPVESSSLVIISIFIGLIPFAQAKILANIIDALIAVTKGSALIGSLWTLIIIYALATVFPEIVYAIQGYVNKRWTFRLQQILELELSLKKAEIDVALHEQPKFQDLLQKATYRSLWPIYELSEAQFLNIQNIIGVVVASYVVLAFDWRLYAVIMIASIPKFFVETKYSKNVWGIYSEDTEQQRHYQELRSNFRQMYRIIETKLLQTAHKIAGMIDDILEDFNGKQIAVEKRKMLMKIGAEVIVVLGYGFAITLIIGNVAQGLLAIGAMTFLLSSLSRLENSIAGFFLNIAGQYQFSLYVTSIFELLDTKPYLPRVENPIRLDLTTAPTIVFENVTFAYAGQTKTVLKDVNLTIKPGEKIAWIGANGAGKSTMVKLLCRVYDPIKGRILVNGVDLKHIDIDEWWSYLGVLLQDFGTYNFMAKDSIAVGRMDMPTDDARVTEAAIAADAHEFISKWEKGYENMIGTDFGGVEPSKGQRQKLALARILYRKSHVLILDEPTAAVDSHSEAKIFETLEKMPDNYSCAYFT